MASPRITIVYISYFIHERVFLRTFTLYLNHKIVFNNEIGTDNRRVYNCLLMLYQKNNLPF